MKEVTFFSVSDGHHFTTGPDAILNLSNISCYEHPESAEEEQLSTPGFRAISTVRGYIDDHGTVFVPTNITLIPPSQQLKAKLERQAKRQMMLVRAREVFTQEEIDLLVKGE